MTVHCPSKHVLIGASEYVCTQTGFLPPIKTGNLTRLLLRKSIRYTHLVQVHFPDITISVRLNNFKTTEKTNK